MDERSENIHTIQEPSSPHTPCFRYYEVVSPVFQHTRTLTFPDDILPFAMPFLERRLENPLADARHHAALCALELASVPGFLFELLAPYVEVRIFKNLGVANG